MVMTFDDGVLVRCWLVYYVIWTVVVCDDDNYSKDLVITKNGNDLIGKLVMDTICSGDLLWRWLFDEIIVLRRCALMIILSETS